MRLVLRTEHGTWTNQRWQRWARVRRRFYAVAFVCLLLCGCVCWPNHTYQFVGMYLEGGNWIVGWESCGVKYHVDTPSYGTAAFIDAVLWGKGRVTAW
jgi:hypothetical protein